MANTQRTPQQWQVIVEQHAASGLQVATFCKKQQITPSSFYAWRKRLAKQPSLPSHTDRPVIAENHQNDWFGISPEPVATPSSSWDIELALPNGVILRMTPH
jgi:hypothetical protein